MEKIMNVMEAMRGRRSVRGFNGEPLAEECLRDLERVAAEAVDPFGGSVTVRTRRFPPRGESRPGTYGVISGARDFFLLAYGADAASALSAGFRFEGVVLEAWRSGLGTCWLGGTFRGSDFDGGEEWPAGEELRVVCPVGVPAKLSLRERLMRAALGSKHREPFGKLFFDGSFGEPLSAGSRFGEALEMARLAPSARNAQPWRVVVAGDAAHFYRVAKGAFSAVDCGIAMRHFFEAERFRGRTGRFYIDPEAPSAPEGIEYLRSYKAVAD